MRLSVSSFIIMSVFLFCEMSVNIFCSFFYCGYCSFLLRYSHFRNVEFASRRGSKVYKTHSNLVEEPELGLN